MKVGKNILIYLVENGISQTWLSEQVGIALPKLYASLNGRRKLPVDEFEKIINALGVEANLFIPSNCKVMQK